MPTYRWLRDTPFAKAGTIFEACNHVWQGLYYRMCDHHKELSISIKKLITDGWLEPADKPMTKTWENLEAGDYVISPTGLKLKIMARLDSTVLTIGPNPNYKQYLMPLVAYDITNLDGFGYTIVQPEPETKYGIGADTSEGEDYSVKLLFGQQADGTLVCSSELKSEPQPERWKPAIGQTYFYLHTELEVTDCVWENDIIDNGMWKVNNCFPTREAAEEAAEKTKALWRSLRK